MALVRTRRTRHSRHQRAVPDVATSDGTAGRWSLSHRARKSEEREDRSHARPIATRDLAAGFLESPHRNRFTEPS
jgi:hypothetical protein